VNHLPALPFLLPALSACLLVLLWGRLRAQRAVAVVSVAALLAVATACLLHTSDGGARVYAMGAWPARLGIVLVLDRLSALMVALTAAVAATSLLYALRGWDARGAHFHPLMQFQIMGLNGAFLTGDLFNLFVCFELMLIASYGLLQHGRGASRLRASVHYVVLNLIGSTLFLVAVSLLYRVGGTLNMADLGMMLAQAPQAQWPWIRAGAGVLLVVFLLKAAAAPLYLWLPGTYGAAAAPVAAIFALLTKVGVYAVLRVYPLVFGASPAADLATTVALPTALGAVAAAALGALSAPSLSTLTAWLALGSTATWLAAVATGAAGAVGGGLYYLLASSLATAGLFLLTDTIARHRGPAADRLERAPPTPAAGLMGAAFFVLAVALSGMPPLAGFLGKFMILQGAPGAPWLWGVILGASLLNIVALSKAGSRLFWALEPAPPATILDRPLLAAPAVLLGLIAALTAVANPVAGFTRQAAAEALDPGVIRGEVLGADPGAPRTGGQRPAPGDREAAP
jgi:multicomponent K+:H+ antiporter subunit D